MGVLEAMSSARLYQVKFVFPNLTLLCHKCHNNNKGDDKKPDKYANLPEAPTNCCMSGCPECVWVEYAEKLTQIFQDGGDEALKVIEEKITDPNMKAFLLHELRMRIQKK